MAKSNRSKKEIERDLKEYAKQISALNEFPEIRPKTELEEKLKMHSPRWNSIFREACADMFYFAASGIVSLKAFGFIWIIIIGNAIGGMLPPVLMGAVGKNSK